MKSIESARRDLRRWGVGEVHEGPNYSAYGGKILWCRTLPENVFAGYFYGAGPQSFRVYAPVDWLMAEGRPARHVSRYSGGQFLPALRYALTSSRESMVTCHGATNKLLVKVFPVDRPGRWKASWQWDGAYFETTDREGLGLARGIVKGCDPVPVFDYLCDHSPEFYTWMTLQCSYGSKTFSRPDDPHARRWSVFDEVGDPTTIWQLRACSLPSRLVAIGKAAELAKESGRRCAVAAGSGMNQLHGYVLPDGSLVDP